MFEWNSYAFISLICFLMSLASAILTLFARRQLVSFLWGLLCVILAAWTLGLFFAFSADNPDDALFWVRSVNYILVFVPSVLFHFCVKFIGRERDFHRIIGLYYLLAFICFVVLLAWPAQFLHSPYLRFSTFWFPVAGELFYLLPLIHILLIGHSVFLLIQAKKSESRTQQRKINYLLTTICIAFFGAGSSWTLQISMNVPPYGIISIAVVVLIATYAILRHDLLDLPETFSLITARILIYIIIFALVVAVIKAGAFFEDISFSDFQLAVISLMMIAVCELYALTKSRIQGLSDKMLIRRKQEKERQFKDLISQLESASDFEAMLPALRKFFESQTYIYHFAWYLDQSLLVHSLKKHSIDEFERSQALKDTSYQRILFSAQDGRRQDRLPSALHMSGLVLNTAKATTQMVALMNSEQLDQAYEWVETVPRRELIALPLIANERFRGLFMFVISQDDIQYVDQATLQTLTSKMAVLVERFDAIREESRIQQAFLLEKMTTLQALAGSIAHEMRSPLNFMDHFVSEVFDASRKLTQMRRLLSDKEPAELLACDEIAKKLRVQSNMARTAIERSLQVIDITLSQLQNKDIDLTMFGQLSIQSVITKALAEYVFLPGEREMVISDLSHSFEFKGDESLLIFVFFNLLNNALLYQHYRKNFEIFIATETGDTYNWVTFRDSGPGILPEQQSKIFNEFYTVNTEHGTGLGLAYCRRVMKSFGGKIECSSIPGEYTEFRLGFPLIN